MRRLLPLVALLGAAPLAAQQPLVSRTLDSATVVRLVLVRGPAFQGMLLAPLTPDAQQVVFAPPAQRDCGVPRIVCRMAVPVADVRTIELRQGSHAGRGAVMGAVIGVFAGFVVGMQVKEWDYCRTTSPGGGCGGPSDVGVIAFTTLVSGAFGAGLGTLFGLGSPAWERAP
jgi:uncharacterized protein YcfJ